jgi:hypothetical protein
MGRGSMCAFGMDSLCPVWSTFLGPPTYTKFKRPTIFRLLTHANVNFVQIERFF